MNLLGKIRSLVESFWQYLGQTQAKNFRILHIVVAILIIFQIINSDFVHTHYGLNWGAYLHICCGLLIAVLSVFLLSMALETRGLRYYYPYLFNDYSAIKKDVFELARFRLPNARSGSFAAVVQGMGLIALFIAWASGVIWFISWNLDLSYTHDLKELHESLVGLIEAYIYAHAFMGLLHYVVQKYFPRFISDVKD